MKRPNKKASIDDDSDLEEEQKEQRSFGDMRRQVRGLYSSSVKKECLNDSTRPQSRISQGGKDIGFNRGAGEVRFTSFKAAGARKTHSKQRNTADIDDDYENDIYIDYYNKLSGFNCKVCTPFY